MVEDVFSGPSAEKGFSVGDAVALWKKANWIFLKWFQNLKQLSRTPLNAICSVLYTTTCIDEWEKANICQCHGKDWTIWGFLGGGQAVHRSKFPVVFVCGLRLCVFGAFVRSGMVGWVGARVVRGERDSGVGAGVEGECRAGGRLTARLRSSVGPERAKQSVRLLT